MSKRLKKTTIQVVVLCEADDTTEGYDLKEIMEKCDNDSWVGACGPRKEEIIEGEEACKEACEELGSSLDFFCWDDEEEDDCCEECGAEFTYKDIDGGRCLSCGAMICSKEPDDV